MWLSVYTEELKYTLIKKTAAYNLSQLGGKSFPEISSSKNLSIKLK